MYLHAVLAPVLAVLVLPLASTSMAAALVPKVQCWTGQIHSPCNGFKNGCTPDGIMVTCQGGTTNGSMIFSSMCGGPNPPWTCTTDANCNAHC